VPSTTSPSSRPASSRRFGPGATISATRCRGAGRGARDAALPRYQDRLPARLPRRLVGSLGGRGHPADRGARARRRGLLMSIYRPLEAGHGASSAASCSAPRGHPVGRAADVRAHGGAGHRRAPVRGHDERRAARLDLRLRADAAVPRELDDEHAREIFQAAFLGVWRGELEDDGLGGAGARGAASPAARSRCSARSTSTCARPGSRSPTAT
jgi:hypothetical protein